VKKIAESTVRRLSLYLRYLEEFETAGRTTVSSGELARSGGTTSAQVRKDLSFFGSFGKRGLGYATHDLVAHIRTILGLDRSWRLVILGAGKIGSAMARHRGFRDRGFQVVGIFDADPQRVGQALDGVTIADAKDLEHAVRHLKADIAVLAVPREEAQRAAMQLVRGGVHAILDFTTAPLEVPEGVTVRSMNLAMELEVLSHALAHR
jgi:redox-sensing transcriptional repressor